MAAGEFKVVVSARTAWAQFIISICKVLQHVPGGLFLIRHVLAYLCWYQVRIALPTGKVLMAWRWQRVPLERAKRKEVH